MNDNEIEVLRRIKEEKVNRYTELDLSSLNIKCLPESIGDLTDLEILTLFVNQLTELSAVYSMFAKLKVLNLGANCFSEFYFKCAS